MIMTVLHGLLKVRESGKFISKSPQKKSLRGTKNHGERTK